MGIRLSDDARQYVALLDEVADVGARDCLIDDAHGQVWFVVPPGEAATAIGPGGETVERVEERVGRPVRIVAWADDPAAFVANALAPAAVYNVTISEPPVDDGDAASDGDRVAYVEVDPADRGVAIGEDGRTIEPARELAKRHHGVDDVQLT